MGWGEITPMKRVLATLISIAVVVLFAIAATASDEPVTELPLVSAVDAPRALQKTIGLSGVGVHYDAVDGRHVGSGVLVGRGYVLTAAHVVQCTDELFVTPLATQQQHKARVVAIDDGLDLALLHIKLPRKTDLRALELAAEHPRRAAQIFGWGRVSSVAAGKVTSGSDRELLARMPLRSGDSGGAALDQDGRLLGIFSSAVIAAPKAYFVPLRDVRSFLNGVKRSKTVRRAELCDPDRLVWSDMKAATKLVERGLESDAILRLDKGLDRDPEPGLEAKIRVTRARLHLAQGMIEETLVDAEAAVAAAPQHLEGRRIRLAALSGLHRWREAQLEAVALLELDRGDPRLWYARLHASKHLGTKEALRALDGYVAQTEGPAQGEALAVRCYIALRRGAADAVAACDAAIALGHEMTWMHHQMADAHRDGGRYTDAVDSYLRALEMGAGRPEWARRCARLLLVLARDAEALQVLTGVHRTEDTRWTEVVALARLGRTEAALERLGDALVEVKRTALFEELMEHLAAGGSLGAVTVEGQVELLLPE
jgi:tetratricopeptide (TPR) repeat protein